MPIRFPRLRFFPASRSRFAGTRAGNRSACLGSMVASLRPTTILALLPPSPVFAASLQPGPAAKCAAWLPAADSLSATASRLSAASPVGRHPRKLASCRRAVAVPAAAIRRTSRPVRFAAGNALLSHAKVGEALGGFPCFAAVRLAPTPRFPACCFVPRFVPRHAGPESAKGEDDFLRSPPSPFLVTQPRPFRGVCRLPLISEWLRYSVPHSRS